MKSISFKDLYFLLVILYSGMAIPLFRSNEGLILLWAVGFIIFWKETYMTNKKLLLALFIWLGYFIINTFIIQSFHPFFMGTYIAKIMIAYWLITYYKSDIFQKFENVIFKLTVISLVFYTIQIIAPSFLFSLFKSVSLSGDLFSNIHYSSIGIYTFHQKELLEFFPRNAGFTWEPGPFSSYIGLALFFNIVRNDVFLKDKKRLLIFFLAIISTQSTTGFLILLFILLWFVWVRYDNKLFRIFSIPVTVSIVLLLFMNIPALQEKILLQSQQNVEDVIDHANISGKTYNPGRFASFQLRWEDFKNYPIAGYGGNTFLQYGYIGEGNVVSAVNGLGNILGRYGAIGAILFLLLVMKSGKLLSRVFKYKGWFVFPALLLIIGFSFGIIEAPIIVTLWLIPIFFKEQYFTTNKII